MKLIDTSQNKSIDESVKLEKDENALLAYCDLCLHCRRNPDHRRLSDILCSLFNSNQIGNCLIKLKPLDSGSEVSIKSILVPIGSNRFMLITNPIQTMNNASSESSRRGVVKLPEAIYSRRGASFVQEIASRHAEAAETPSPAAASDGATLLSRDTKKNKKPDSFKLLLMESKTTHDSLLLHETSCPGDSCTPCPSTKQSLSCSSADTATTNQTTPMAVSCEDGTREFIYDINSSCSQYF